MTDASRLTEAFATGGRSPNQAGGADSAPAEAARPRLMPELRRSDALGQAGGAPNVSEEDREIDLRPARGQRLA